MASLNPHAGEDGLFGDEEERIIAPAVALAQREGIKVTGPYPNDTLFYHALAGSYDAVVAIYHDQGHIASRPLDSTVLSISRWDCRSSARAWLTEPRSTSRGKALPILRACSKVYVSPPGSWRADSVRRRSSWMAWASLCCIRGNDPSASLMLAKATSGGAMLGLKHGNREP